MEINSDNNKCNIIKYLLIIIIIIIIFKLYKNCGINKYGLSFEQKIKDYGSKTFSIIRREGCPNCDFFSFYIFHLGCFNKLISEGSIPIVDLKSFPNVYNNGNITANNPWELFFYQPNNYTLEEVEKYAKNFHYFKCTSKINRPNEKFIYYNNSMISFWHNFAKNYSPIRYELIDKAKMIKRKLFGNSKNILGVKLRGTDYIIITPKYHSIQPKVEKLISDVKDMDLKYKYDFIFFLTENELIRQRFIKKFGDKLKFLNHDAEMKFNHNNMFINLNKKIYRNLDYIKNYFLNIIILSQCLDIITYRCSGAAGIIIHLNI